MPDTVSVSSADVQVVSGVLTLAARAFGSSMGEIPLFGVATEACGRMTAAAEQARMPEDPVSTPSQVAIAHNEMMRAYESAGFTREEAFTIVLTYITANASANAMRSAHG